MNMHKPRLLIITVGVAISFLCVCYYFFSPSVFLRLSNVNFPLEKLWSQNLNSAVVDISTASDNSKILVRTKSVLYAMQPDDGKISWIFPLSRQVNDSPARSIAGMVFITDSEFVRALDINDGKAVWEQSLPENSGRLVDVSESLVLVNQVSYEIRGYDTQSGQLLWDVPAGRGFVQAYINRDVVYVVDYGIRAVNATTGESVWQYGNNVIGESIYNDGIIYYTSGHKITAFNTRTQMEIWNAGLPNNGLQRLKLDNGILFVMDESYLYEFDKSTGAIVWQRPISHPTNPVVIADNIYIMEGFSRMIHVFNPTTNSEIGHIRVSSPRLVLVDRQDMFSSTDILLFSTGQHIYAYK